MSAADLITALAPDARAAALSALDEISQPLTVRDLDRALAGHIPRSQRRPLMRALLNTFDIIAVVPKE